MPIECELLATMPCNLKTCPKCGAPFRPFLRGLVQRSLLSWAGFQAILRGEYFPYCALICWECKEIVGYE